MKNLIQRTLTGILFVAAIIGTMFWNPLAFGLIFLISTIIGLHEFYKLVTTNEVKPQKITGIFLGSFIYVIMVLVANHYLPPAWLWMIMPITILAIISELLRRDGQGVQNFVFTIFGMLYVAIPFGLLNMIMNPGLNSVHAYPELLLAFFALVWINDIFAYLSGTLVGKHTLFERLSPKKTWEGSLGGLIFSLAAGYALYSFLGILPIWLWLLITIVVVVFGTLGDLAESMLKRQAGVKDSGNILPGHGGILDRFDSIFFAAPVVTAILMIWYN